jgi:tetratricopeptide (TPR) repeat protein
MTDQASPTALESLLRAGQAHHLAGRLAEARASYLAVLHQDPEHAPALGLLALTHADDLDAPETEAVVQRHLALRPFDGASLHLLGQIRARQGDDAEAAVLLEGAANWLPKLAPIHNDLGVALHRLGRTEAALAALDRAIALNPAFATPQANRGDVLQAAGRADDALDAYLTALGLAANAPASERASILHAASKTGAKAHRLAEVAAAAEAELAREDDPDLAEQTASILDGMGRREEALAIRNRQARAAGPRRAGPADPAARVLVLGGVGAGHVPVRYLLDTARLETWSLGMLSPDQQDAPLGSVDIEALAVAEVVFNTLGDIDRDGGQHAAARALCARLGKPVLNPLDSIARTGRDNAPALFGDIDGVIVPEVHRITPEALATTEIAAPMLVRPAGDHGGDNLILLHGAADRDAYLAAGASPNLVATRFHDFRSADGHWRKYRFIFVDRQVFPYHLAIGDDWLVHYWRAEMGRDPSKKAEEEAFLADWRGVFGATGASAIDQVARRLDLDYGGLDCALMDDGRVLFFEANACILVHLDEPPRAFPYKHRYVPPIREAFTRLVLERAGKIAG